MFFHGEIFSEIGNLGNNDKFKTLLLHSKSGQNLVYKEVPRDMAEVFRRLIESPHPNIAQVYEIRAMDEDICGIFMEYAGEKTLENELLQKGKMSSREAFSILKQLCQAVRHFHSLGIIHRDLKPMNILIDSRGWVKIIDFGIARIYRKGKDSDTSILGTVGYAAPEQFGFLQTDERSDVYALGVILNRLLTGKMPGKIIYEGNARIENIIKRCIKMAPEDRCSLDELEEALGGGTLKKRNWKKFLIKKIPGFRTGNKVYMTLATVEYIYMGIIFLMLIPVSENIFDYLQCLLGLIINTVGIGWLIGNYKTVRYFLKIRGKICNLLLGLVYIVGIFFVLSVGIEFMN